MTSATGRAAIEASLGCRVTERYLSSEVPALTSQCRNGAFHVNADWYILEPVDENYQPVPAGVRSYTALVTNLANRVQPIIRYDLGDRVTLATSPCPCGSPFPAVTIEGRAGDLVSFEAPDGRAVTVLPLALGTVIEETAGVRRFQAIRTGPGTLRLRLETEPDADRAQVQTAVEQRLGSFFATQGTGPIAIDHADEPPRTDRSGKFRQVWSA